MEVRKYEGGRRDEEGEILKEGKNGKEKKK